MNLTKNFKLVEFASPDADCFPIKVINNLIILAKNLQKLRDYIEGIYIFYPAIHINSGWRTPEHNKYVGGVSNSQHLYGKAADIWVAGLSPVDLHAIIIKLIKRGVMHDGGLGLYDTFNHYDVRENESRWDYRT